MRAPRPKPPAPPLLTTKLFSFEPAPFLSIGYLPINTLCHSCVRIPVTRSGCKRPVRKRTCIRAKFTHVTRAGGKVKTSAFAAFLGDSALSRQNESNCCADVTFLRLKAD